MTLQEVIGLIGAVSTAAAAVWGFFIQIFGRRNERDELMKRVQLVNDRLFLFEKIEKTNLSQSEKEFLLKYVSIDKIRESQQPVTNGFSKKDFLILWLVTLAMPAFTFFGTLVTNDANRGIPMIILSLIGGGIVSWILARKIKNDMLRPFLAFIISVPLLIIAASIVLTFNPS